MGNEQASFFVGGVVLGIVLGTFVFAFISDVVLDAQYFTDETLDDICFGLTHNAEAEGNDEQGKLVCTIPSYDHTTNIIVRPAGAEHE